MFYNIFTKAVVADALQAASLCVVMFKPVGMQPVLCCWKNSTDSNSIVVSSCLTCVLYIVCVVCVVRRLFLVCCAIYSPALGKAQHCLRWLAAAEKGALLGFPVLKSTADVYGCQELQWDQLSDPHSNFGNTMHIPNVAAVILATLLSVQLCRA